MHVGFYLWTIFGKSRKIIRAGRWLRILRSKVRWMFLFGLVWQNKNEIVKSFREFEYIFLVELFHRSWKLRWKQIDKSSGMEAINFDPKKRPRRQDWSGEFIETGMFYFMRRDLIEHHGILQNDRFEQCFCFQFFKQVGTKCLSNKYSPLNIIIADVKS